MFQIYVKEDVASSSVIATLPASVVPIRQFWAIASSNGTGNKTTRVSVNSNGTIVASGPVDNGMFVYGRFITS